MFRRTKAVADLQNQEALAIYTAEVLAKDYISNRNNAYGDTYLSKEKLPKDVQVLLLSYVVGKDMQPQPEAAADAELAESINNISSPRA